MVAGKSIIDNLDVLKISVSPALNVENSSDAAFSQPPVDGTYCTSRHCEVNNLIT